MAYSQDSNVMLKNANWGKKQKRFWIFLPQPWNNCKKNYEIVDSIIGMKFFSISSISIDDEQKLIEVHFTN